MTRIKVILKDGTPVDADHPLPVSLPAGAVTLEGDLDMRHLDKETDTVNVAMNGVTVDETHPVAVMVPGRVGIEGDNTTDVKVSLAGEPVSIAETYEGGTAVGETPPKGIVSMMIKAGNIVPINDTGNALPVTLGSQITSVEQRPTRDTPAPHRVSISTPDKLVSSTPTAAEQLGQAGTLTAVAHGFAVSAMNDYGIATPVMGAASHTPTAGGDKSVDISIPEVTGATKYKVFLSTSTTAPQWVGTITAQQRTDGCSITAPGVIGAAGPGGAGIVNVQCVGTGFASTDPIFQNNNAYTPELIAAPIAVQRNSVWLYIDVTSTTLGTVRPTLNMIPFFSRNEEAGIYYQGLPVTIDLLSKAGASLRQAYKLECEGNKYVKILLSPVGCTVSVSSEKV